MTIRFPILLVGVVLIGFVVYWLIPPKPEPVVSTPQPIKLESPKLADKPTQVKITRPTFTWDVDTKYIYTYTAITEVNTNTNLGQGGLNQWQKVLISTQGDLNVRIFGQYNDQVYIGFQMSPFSIQLNQQRLIDIEQIYVQRFFIAALSVEGIPEKFFFPKNVVQSDRDALIEIVQGTQVYLPHQSMRNRWVNQETDIAGQYVVNYQLSDPDVSNQFRLDKHKTAYTKVDVEQTGQFKTEPELRIIQSAFQITVAQQQAWFIKLAGEERLELHLGDKIVSETYNQLTVKRSTKTLNQTLAIWQADADPFKVIAAFERDDSPQTSVAEIREQQKKAALRAQLKHLKPADLIKPIVAFDVDKMQMQDILDDKRLLEKYLSVFPEAVNLVTDVLSQYQLSHANSALLVGVLANVGHEEAQQALANIITEETQRNDQVTDQAMFSATQVADIKPVLIEALRETAQLDDALKSGSAFLSLGAISSRLSDVNPSESVALRQEIVSYLDTQTEPEQQAVALHALANTQNNEAETAQVVAPYLESEDENVREAAFDVFRHFDDNESFERLITGATVDDSSDVRRKAVTVLTDRADAVQAVAPVSQQLAQESNERVRQAMIDLLAQHNTEPQAVTALKQQLNLETSREMKKAIYKALYAK